MGVFGKGEGVVEVAAELVVVGGEEEEEEGVVGACGTVFGSSTTSFRVGAAAAEVEVADLGRLFWGEGTRKKKRRKEGKRVKFSVRVPSHFGKFFSVEIDIVVNEGTNVQASVSHRSDLRWLDLTEATTAATEIEPPSLGSLRMAKRLCIYGGRSGDELGLRKRCQFICT
ncbi:hypothetical protein TIFTF001_014012 [Ficus carica]|uniref:Uncharacterized protein n=1 Tax=Ficus carica TaxID=3494 RepID=A0AA88A4I6_FICCA|nr:hypothetical protein TIFTF001_014012 [Ficus carica]